MNLLPGRKKLVRVFLPIGYYETDKRYPVLYMHDGQNLIDKSNFSGASWQVMDTMDAFHNGNKDMIIVGMDCSNRYRSQEYSPTLSKSMIKYIARSYKLNIHEVEPEADEYGDFIVRQVKPFIDREFRTIINRDNTFIAGSSCGGNISIYLGMKHQDVFSAIGAFSPAYQCVGRKFISTIRNIHLGNFIKIYHDMGTKENRFWSLANLIYQREFDWMIRKKIGADNVLMKVDKGAKHSEIAWAKRFPEFYEFCFKK